MSLIVMGLGYVNLYLVTVGDNLYGDPKSHIFWDNLYGDWGRGKIWGAGNGETASVHSLYC
jgi:hypothetical protein